MTSTQHGAWVWYELMTTDTAAAARFYGDVIGWQARDAGYPDMPYTLLGRAGRDIAGMMHLPPQARANNAPPRWVGYVAVDDVDTTAGEVGRRGGRLHMPPEDIPGVGRFAVAADPHGAAFVLFTPTMPPRAPAPPGPGDCGWRELMADDLDEAFAFYAGLFGWTKDHVVDMGPMGPYQIFAHDGVAVGGMMTKPAATSARWRYYFHVDGLTAAIARIEAAGGTVVSGPHEVPGDDWVVHAADPQGAHFALVSKVR